MKDTIALIIPFYNGSKFIEDAIRSAHAQTLPFDEIHLVNDGSLEEHTKVVIGLLEKYKFTYHAVVNGGQGFARNFGASQAKSSYLCFLDQDDILHVDHNKVLLNAIKLIPDHERGIVYANFSTIDSDGMLITRHARPPRNIDIHSDLYAFFAQDIFVLPSATIVAKKAFIDVGGFDNQFRGYEDDDLFIRIFRAGYDYKFINKDVYFWRMHEDQTSSQPVMLESRIKFISKWSSLAYSKSIDVDLIKKYLDDRFIRVILKDRMMARNKKMSRLTKDIILKIIRLNFSSISFRKKIVYIFFYLFPPKLIRLCWPFRKYFALPK